MRPAPLFVSALFLSLLTPAPAPAAWPVLGRTVVAAPGDQKRPVVATDGSGGAIIVWTDLGATPVNLFGRRVFATGELDPAWPVDGRALLTDPAALANAASGQTSPDIVADGDGGAIIVWQDGRSATEGFDIFAQHVLASGVVDPAWPANGRVLSTTTNHQGFRPKIAADGDGGAVVTWTQVAPSSFADVYAQHVMASGVVDPTWPANGVALVLEGHDQFFSEIAADGSGGAIVTWIDDRAIGGSSDIYAQHVMNSGVVDPAWPVNGRALCGAVHDQLNPSISSDGTHGAIVTWEDNRDLAFHIYAQRVLGSGAIAPGWPVDGRAVCTVAPNQKEPRIVTDSAGGAIVTWEDYRHVSNEDPVNTNPFVQHVLSSGAIDAAWPVDGRGISNDGGEGTAITLVVDGAGGAIVAWEQDGVVMTHHVRATGTLDPTFPANGRVARNIPSAQHTPALVVSGTGGAIVAWADGPNESNFDIYAINVVTQIVAGVDPPARSPEFTFARPAPNPAQGPVTLRFALPGSARVRLSIYDVAGRRVRAIADGQQATGEHTIAWDQRDDAGRTVTAGMYFARMEVNGRVLTQKLVTLR